RRRAAGQTTGQVVIQFRIAHPCRARGRTGIGAGFFKMTLSTVTLLIADRTDLGSEVDVAAQKRRAHTKNVKSVIVNIGVSSEVTSGVHGPAQAVAAIPAAGGDGLGHDGPHPKCKSEALPAPREMRLRGPTDHPIISPDGRTDNVGRLSLAETSHSY